MPYVSDCYLHWCDAICVSVFPDSFSFSFSCSALIGSDPIQSTVPIPLPLLPHRNRTHSMTTHIYFHHMRLRYAFCCLFGPIYCVCLCFAFAFLLPVVERFHRSLCTDASPKQKRTKQREAYRKRELEKGKRGGREESNLVTNSSDESFILTPVKGIRLSSTRITLITGPQRRTPLSVINQFDNPS